MLLSFAKVHVCSLDNYSHFLDVVKPDCLSIDYDIDPECARTHSDDLPVISKGTIEKHVQHIKKILFRDDITLIIHRLFSSGKSAIQVDFHVQIVGITYYYSFAFDHILY